MKGKTMTKGTTTIAEDAAKASTADEHLAVMERIQRDLSAAEAVVSELEGKRDAVLFTGDDPGQYHDDMFQAVERVKTLRAGLGTARKRYDAASKVEIRQALEAKAAAVQVAEVPALTTAWAGFHDALVAVLAAAEQIGAHRSAIDDLNGFVERAGRSDLLIAESAARMAAIRDIGGPASVTTLPTIKRMSGESDEAFILRRGNAQQQASAAIERADPFRDAGDKAMAVIQELVFDMDAFVRGRNRRVMTETSFVSAEGVASRRIYDSPDSSISSPRMSPVGPYRPGAN